MSDKFMTAEELSLYLGVTTACLAQWRKLAKGPPFIQCRKRGKVLYRKESVSAWVNGGQNEPRDFN